MRVLLVAPRSDLENLDTEVSAILRSGLDVVPLLGNITHADLVRETEQSSYDILWVLAHGSKGGIVLSDGILPSSLLTSLIRNAGFRLVVLNTCDSINTAQMLQNETGAEVIATIGDVDDSTAYQTGALFARALATTRSIHRAYRQARPGGNDSYVRLSPDGGAIVRVGGKLTDEIHELVKAIYELKQEIALLKLRLEAIEKFEAPASQLSRYFAAIVTMLIVISVLAGMGLYLLATGGIA